MELTPRNTDFCALYVGLSEMELVELGKLVSSFREHFDHKLVVMDMSKASHEAVRKGERLWQQDLCYSYDIEPTLSPEASEGFFLDNQDVVIRQQSSRYEMRAHRMNRAIYECLHKPFALFLDSDIWFRNGRFFSEATELLRNCPDKQFGAMAHITAAMPFRPMELIYGSRRFSFWNVLAKTLYRMHNWVLDHKFSKLKGFGRLANHDPTGRRKKAMFPRPDPAFLLINRQAFVERNILFRLLYLNIEDLTTSRPTEYRVLGDEGAAVFFELATHKLRAVNFDYSTWACHEGGSWQAMRKKQANWFYIGGAEGTDPDFWQDKSLPSDQIYQPRPERK